MPSLVKLEFFRYVSGFCHLILLLSPFMIFPLFIWLDLPFDRLIFAGLVVLHSPKYLLLNSSLPTKVREHIELDTQVPLLHGTKFLLPAHLLWLLIVPCSLAKWDYCCCANELLFILLLPLISQTGMPYLLYIAVKILSFLKGPSYIMSWFFC